MTAELCLTWKADHSGWAPVASRIPKHWKLSLVVVLSQSSAPDAVSFLSVTSLIEIQLKNSACLRMVSVSALIGFLNAWIFTTSSVMVTWPPNFLFSFQG